MGIWRKLASGMAAAVLSASVLALPAAAAGKSDAAYIDANNRAILDESYFHAVDYSKALNDRLTGQRPKLMSLQRGEYADEALTRLTSGSEESMEMIRSYDQYDALGNVVAYRTLDQNGLESYQYSFDAHGYSTGYVAGPTADKPEDSSVWTNTYNKAGQLIESRILDTYSRKVSYDQAGRVVQVDNYNNGVQSDTCQYTYENNRLAGMNSSSTTGSLEKASFSYDDQGRLTYIIDYTGGYGTYFTGNPNTYRISYNADGSAAAIDNAFFYQKDVFSGFKYRFYY